MNPHRRLLLSLLACALLSAPEPRAAARDPALPVRQGWVDADLGTVVQQAERTGHPILVLVRSLRCGRCDIVEAWLTEDAEIAALTGPFLKLRVLTDEARPAPAAVLFKVQEVPAVLLLGPEGRVATRQEGNVERSWLKEQLQVVSRRHQHRPPPHVTSSELQESFARLQSWGDRDGMEALRRKLSEQGVSGVSHRHPLSSWKGPQVETRSDLEALFSSVEEPPRLRDLSFRLSLALEQEDRTELALDALYLVADRLRVDPVTEARAAFLASRHKLSLESTRQRLKKVRQLVPDSVPVLLALARVGEETGRLYEAFHSVEAAAVYLDEDGWIRMELYRLRLLVKLGSRKVNRDPA
ncbi:MAG: thioredoxin family protein [Acidobacteriota bacterium]